MERTKFDRLVREALADLYDYAALETHPLASVFCKSPDRQESRAECLRRLLLEAIERLRPPGREPSMGSVEWRPYLILHGRYVEGLNLQELQTRFSLSARQLRREHSRALQAIATLLWDQAFPGQIVLEVEEDEGASLRRWGSNFEAFEITSEPLDLAQVAHEVAGVFRCRVQSEEVELNLTLPEELPHVQADRVILRQILFTLLRYALHRRTVGDITIGAEIRADQVALWIGFQTDEQSPLAVQEKKVSLDAARYWIKRLGATLRQEVGSSVEGAVSARLVLSLPRSEQSLILVVDDQEPAIRMFRRYLSHSNVRVVGAREAEQVLPLARQLQPRVITLDVMMPTMDGWEILQTLQADPETRHIPVIICSVWDEPELASSLGAAYFLKKPITQKDLLGALAQLGLLDIPDGSFPASTSR